MVQLSKNTNPLLRTVRGREHASKSHHEPEPEPHNHVKDVGKNGFGDQIDRDAESNLDDSDEDKDTSALGSTKRSKNSRIARAPQRTERKVADAHSPSKRQGSPGDDQDDPIFGPSQSSQPSKRPRKTFTKKYSSQDIKNKPATASSKKFETPAVDPRRQLEDAKSKFKKPLGQTPSSSQPEGPAFRQPSGASAFRDPCSTEGSTFSQPAVLVSSQLSEPSSPLSSVAESDVELVIDPPCKNEISCPLCGSKVDTEFRDNFQNDVCGGRRMNMRMQEKFCQAHKAHNATQIWRDRGYPEIDWSGLQKRLETHRAHLEAVLIGDFESSYRKEHRKLVKSRDGDTAAKAINAGVNTLRAGYYGTRGEKLMADHIVRRFSSKLRGLATSDKAISSRGTSGGVSGFVHSVLVPELAVCLIMEDMDCDRTESMRIMADSADVGEMLNEEEDEKMPQTRVDLSSPLAGERDSNGRTGKTDDTSKTKKDEQSKPSKEDDKDEGSNKSTTKMRKEIVLLDDLSD